MSRKLPFEADNIVTLCTCFFVDVHVFFLGEVHEVQLRMRGPEAAAAQDEGGGSGSQCSSSAFAALSFRATVAPTATEESTSREDSVMTHFFGAGPWHGPVKIFRNELLEGLQVNFFAKTPVRPLRTLQDMRFLLAVRILVGVLQFRVVSR